MQSSGLPSWRLAISDTSQSLHFALYVRDSCQLEVLDVPVNPPRLGGNVIDRSRTFEGTYDAGADWQSWWHEMLVIQGTTALGTFLTSSSLDATNLIDESPYEWPKLDGITSRPALHNAIQLSHDDAIRWCNDYGNRLSMRGNRTVNLSHLPIAAIADRVINRFRVTPSMVRAAVWILGVQGEWSDFPLPGVLLCSEAVTADAAKMGSLIERAFVEGTKLNKGEL